MKFLNRRVRLNYESNENEKITGVKSEKRRAEEVDLVFGQILDRCRVQCANVRTNERAGRETGTRIKNSDDTCTHIRS